MSFINPIPRQEATGTTSELYAEVEKIEGYIPNYIYLFSHRPEVYRAWQVLAGSIRKHMSFRRYALITLAAARALRGTYCMVAYGCTLLESGEVDENQLAAIANDYHQAGLSADEVAIMTFAEKVITSSGQITQMDVDHLKSVGLTDAEILDITLAATARSFFSKTLDALNAEPDAAFLRLISDLHDTLSVGRPFGNHANRKIRFPGE